jgi:hypothetical protein
MVKDIEPKEDRLAARERAYAIAQYINELHLTGEEIPGSLGVDLLLCIAGGYRPEEWLAQLSVAPEAAERFHQWVDEFLDVAAAFDAAQPLNDPTVN